MEQEIEIKECFGTFDNTDPQRGCNDCEDNARCESFKPKLAEHKAAAADQAVDDYISTSTHQRKQTSGKVIGYMITLMILAAVFWQVAQEYR